MNADDSSKLVKKLRGRIDTWDRGTSMERVQFLFTFLSEFEGHQPADICSKLGYGASLLLARFLVWLQVTFVHGRHVALLIKVLSLFIEDVDGCRFTSEVVHGGLLPTLLDIIRRPSFSNQDKISAMELLEKIASRSQQYKEEICQIHGVKVLCEFIAHHGCGEKKGSHTASEKEGTSRWQVQPRTCNQTVMGKAQKLLITISCGNPEYQMQIIQALLVLMTSINTEAQLVTCKVLIKILPHAMTMCSAAIDPLLGLLGCDDMRLLEKALELMKIVVRSHHGERLSKSLILLAFRKCVSETNVTDLNTSQEHLQCDALLAIENLLDTSTLQHFLSLGLENTLVMNMPDISSPDANRLSAQVLSKIRTVRSAILVKAMDKQDACNGGNIYDSQTSSEITSHVDEFEDKLETSNTFINLENSDDHSKKITKVEESTDLQQALEPSQNLDESFSLSSDEQDAVDLPEGLEDFEYLSLDLDEPNSISEI